MVPPASRMRVTTVASTSGTYPSSVEAPLFIIGTPATQMLSLMATALPFSGPSAAPLIALLTYQAPCGFSSAGMGRRPGVRG